MAVGIDRHLCLSGSLPLLYLNSYLMCISDANKCSQSVSQCLCLYNYFILLFISIWVKHNAVSVQSICHHKQQDSVGDGRIRPRCCHLPNWTKRKRRLWLWPIRFVMWKHNSLICFLIIVKPLVHNILQEKDQATAIGRLITHTENLMKFGYVFLRHASGQTDRQTHRHDDRNTSHPYRGRGEVIMATSFTADFLRVKCLSVGVVELNIGLDDDWMSARDGVMGPGRMLIVTTNEKQYDRRAVVAAAAVPPGHGGVLASSLRSVSHVTVECGINAARCMRIEAYRWNDHPRRRIPVFETKNCHRFFPLVPGEAKAAPLDMLAKKPAV